MKQKEADNFLKEVAKWRQLADLIEHFSYFNGYDWLFRGVTDASHDLTPNTRGMNF